MSGVVWFVVITGLASLGVLALGVWEYRKDGRILEAELKHHHKKAA